MAPVFPFLFSSVFPSIVQQNKDKARNSKPTNVYKTYNTGKSGLLMVDKKAIRCLFFFFFFPIRVVSIGACNILSVLHFFFFLNFFPFFVFNFRANSLHRKAMQRVNFFELNLFSDDKFFAQKR